MPIPIQEAEIAFCLLCLAAAQKITHATHSVNCLACRLWYCMVEFFLWLLINSTLLLSLLLLIHVVLGLLIVNCLTSLLLVFFPYAKQISLMVFGSLNRFLFKQDNCPSFYRKKMLVRFKWPLNQTYTTLHLPNSKEKWLNMTTQLVSHESMASKVSNLWCRWSCFWHLADIIQTPT